MHKCGPTSIPLNFSESSNHYFACVQLGNCLTACIIWWYSVYTYIVGEVLMQSNVLQKVVLGCAALANLARVLVAVFVALTAIPCTCPPCDTGRTLVDLTDQSDLPLLSRTTPLPTL